MSDRETQLLDAAIDVLGTRGTRHLTHRAVDARAGLPLGSTSNRFRTRESLLAGVLGRILDREIAAWTTLGTVDPADRDGFTRSAGRLVRELSTGGRVLTLARHAIMVEAAAHPPLQRQIADAQRRLIAWAAPLVAALGSADPERHLRLLLALIDGLLTNQLAHPDPEFDPETAIATLLRGMLGRTAG
ncbi:TetR/AcrR family transcriptional regulator [Prauserella muralis]|uniref:TetR family transcriptional regulator n=1 Tax=Prauserella muralis TaxID=588067 RepID=A0A2V4ATF4_9PSEU|nr:TetR/AcrR family transcriptional regulator [Prauserella muralis]PXY24627.1 TetR family transcriptional regulator [Prauserella muralis]TWE27686.1 TetR family transcriptional regulator [Prauserella muralis]